MMLFFFKGRTKSVVREAMANYMDEGVLNAPKRTVHTPQNHWLKSSPLRGYVLEIINSPSFSDRNYFDVKKVKKLFKNFCNGDFNNSFFVWQWLNLELWHRIFIDKDCVKNPYPLNRLF